MIRDTNSTTMDPPNLAGSIPQPENTRSPLSKISAHGHIPHKKNAILGLILLVVLFAGIAITMLSLQTQKDTRSRATLTGPTLALSPATKTATIGETFSLGITMNTNADTVSAAELHLSYDPTAIQILSFTPGAILPVVLVPETHTNGVISVILGVQPASPFKGADIMGTWTIKILAAKQSSIAFTSATRVAALGKDTDALVSATGTTIIGTLVSTPTPTKTPTPTPLPSGTPGPSPTPTPLLGDITGEEGVPDGVVDLFDYSAIVEHYGETGAPGFRPEDITGEEGVPDGVVDLFDLSVVIENYGKTR
jgi:hypothetical protein